MTPDPETLNLFYWILDITILWDLGVYNIVFVKYMEFVFCNETVNYLCDYHYYYFKTFSLSNILS